jgi:hypothetical protein
VGSRLRSQVCDGEIMLIRVDGVTAPLMCGGQPMLDINDPEPSLSAPDPDEEHGLQLGKRYEFADDAAGVRLEALVTKAGQGQLRYQGTPLWIKPTKPLPSSD